MPGRARRTGGLTAGAPAVFDRKPYTIPYKKFVRANGLTLIVHEDHSTPVVGVNVWYHVGSRNDARGKTGFAHLFEHFFFNGSQNYPHGFREAMDDLGSNNRNGTTNTDRTNFFEDVSVSALERTLFLESDRMGFLGNYRQALELWHLWPVDVPARPARVHGVAPVQTDKTKESMLEVAKEIKGVAGERPLAGEEYASIMRNMTSRLAGRFATLSALECAAITSLNLGRIPTGRRMPATSAA